MSGVDQETLDKIKASIEHSLKVCQISSPPRPIEISHFLGNAFGEPRSNFLNNGNNDLLLTIQAGLTLLTELTGLKVFFDAESGKFGSGKDYRY